MSVGCNCFDWLLIIRWNGQSSTWWPYNWWFVVWGKERVWSHFVLIMVVLMKNLSLRTKKDTDKQCIKQFRYRPSNRFIRESFVREFNQATCPNLLNSPDLYKTFLRRKDLSLPLVYNCWQMELKMQQVLTISLTVRYHECTVLIWIRLHRHINAFRGNSFYSK